MKTKIQCVEMLSRFNKMEEDLESQRNLSIVEANELSESILNIEKSTAEIFWNSAWFKPVFSFVNLATAGRWVDEIAKPMENAWRNVGEKDSWLAVERDVETGVFNIAGEALNDIRSISNIPLKRVFAIKGAAVAVKARSNAEYPFSEYSVQSDQNLQKLLTDIRAEFGLFWGPATALHLLTEFGLACKPDIHLVRAVRHLGIGLSFVEDSPHTVRRAVEVVCKVKELVVCLDGVLSQKRLRYVDKVLMEYSRCVMGNPPQNPLGAACH
jgi:hypothetical protein